jgi:beta-glucanase (GH16 family)
MNAKLPIIFFFSALMAATACAQEYKLVWSDEFDDNTIGKNWNAEVVSAPSNNELQYYTDRPSNVKIEGGNLVLTARRESYGSRYFTSGRVNSNNKVSFTHGKIEARIKMPRLANGLWPAFWLMGEDITTAGWPACGEIDVMEAGHQTGLANGASERYFAGCIHWGKSIPEHQMYSPGAVTSTYDITGDYHLFTAVWDENMLKCYLDDAAEPYFQASIGKGTASGDYFHKPFHLLFNLAVGGDYPGIYSQAGITALPQAGSEAKMYVDYVRVYQKEGMANAVWGQNDRGGETIPAALRPVHPAASVVSIFSDAYAPAGNGGFDTWGSPGEVLSVVYPSADDAVQKVANFLYVGYNFNADYSVIDLSAMHRLHADVYTDKAFSIGMTPVSKDPSGDYTKNREYVIRYPLQPGWNALDAALADYTAGNPGIDLTQIHQMKWDGGDAASDIYIDNVYFYTTAGSGISGVQASRAAARWYTLKGQQLSAAPQAAGLYICDGRKVVMNQIKK